MGTPFRFLQVPSRLLPQDKSSAEFRALSSIAESLRHPQRTLLSAFIQEAVDREFASRFFIDEVLVRNNVTIAEFLTDWIVLIQNMRPVICKDIDASLKQRIMQRDEGRCCILKALERRVDNESPLVVYILSPTLFRDNGMVQGGRLYAMCAAFIGESQLQYLSTHSVRDYEFTDHDLSDQLMLLSPRAFKLFESGSLCLEEDPFTDADNSAQYFVVQNRFFPSSPIDVPLSITLKNRAMDSSSLPNARLISIHRQFAPALAWLEVSEHMTLGRKSSPDFKSYEPVNFAKGISATKNWIQWCMQPAPRLFRYLWVKTPVFIRGLAYKYLTLLGQRLYGDTGSYWTFKLPFNYYIRKSSRSWAPKHQAELEALRLVEKYTRVPAPRGVDCVQYADSSFLLMTGLPGQGIGKMLETMTDKQVDTVAQDLKEYITQLRNIPNQTGSDFQICNSLGDGILDWRIGDSQREDLRFRDESEFGKYLTHDLSLDENAWKQVSKSHSVKHEIVFTHADLNLRNILVDENGRISGIVDWESAGWYPEYWEYTKMHFTVRATSRWLADVANEIFPNYQDELEVEDLLSSMKPPW